MAQYSRLKVLTTMIETGMVPVFYNPDPGVAVNVIKACLDGGVRCFEFTNRGDRAHEVFGEVIKQLKSDNRLQKGRKLCKLAGNLNQPWMHIKFRIIFTELVTEIFHCPSFRCLVCS